ncbi:MAG: acyltransferase [Acidobacteria bacterium]|nr:acyltransferase [Acidobacteriota bacterium]MBW4045652.1 acyltransferase [Acidobacteriota bacterium]
MSVAQSTPAAINRERIAAAAAPKARGFYRPELDALRFMAFLGVFCLHVVPGVARRSTLTTMMDTMHDAGALGVCLFFMLSSYLITELLFREREKTGNIHLRAFYVRRILRIWPLYLAAILLAVSFSWAGPLFAISKGNVIAYLTMWGNWYAGWHGYPHNFTTPLWSISVEEQFYLLWPLLVLLGGRRAVLGTSLLVMAGSAVAIAVLCRPGVDITTVIWTNTFVQFQSFAMGGLLALALRGSVPKMKRYLRLPLLLSGGLLCWSADLIFHIHTLNAPALATMLIPGYLCANLGCVGIFLAFLGAELPGWATPLVYLGKISFGLYVLQLLGNGLADALVERITPLQTMHYTAIGVRAVLALLFTIVFASFSYRYLETPFLKVKERFMFIRSRAV